MTQAEAAPRFAPVPLALALVLCVFAGWEGWRAVADQPWPFFHDAWRDIGVAQSILDGTFPGDPILHGETHWYNPGVGFVVAAIAKATGFSPAVVDARAGAFLNLTIPVLFFLLAWRLFGPWSGLAALTGLILINGTVDHPGLFLETMTYAPWLWATHLGHAPFYGALLCFLEAQRRGSMRWYAATGVLWGLTFMVHTTPAVVMGGLVVLCTAAEIARGGAKPARRRAGRATSGFLLATGTAFTVSLPYSLPILLHYQFAVVNAAPMGYVDYIVQLDRLPETLRGLLTAPNGVALFGFGLLLWRPPERVSRRLLVSWALVTSGFLLWGYGAQWLARERQVNVPTLVPLHHFPLMVSTLKALCFGWGVAGGLRLAVGATVPAQRLGWVTSALILVVLTGVAVVKVPVYRGHDTFSPPADYGWHRTDWADRPVVVDWLTANTPPEAVVLCDDQVALRLVMPAARNVVQTISIFMNPYVPCEPRVSAQQKLLNALAAGDLDEFRSIAEAWKVTHVLVQDASAIPEHRGTFALSCDDVTGLTLVFREADVCLYAVR